MVPSQNLLYHNCIPAAAADSYSGYFFGSYNNNGDDHLMADHQEESRSNNSLNEATIGSTSRDQQHGLDHDHDEGWLQLGIGGNINHVDTTTTTTTTSSSTSNTTRSSPSTTALVELDLLNSNSSMLMRSTNTIASQPPFIHQVLPPSSFPMFPQLRMTDFNSLLLLQQQQHQQQQHQHQPRRHQQQDTLNWSFSNRPFITTSQFATTSIPSSSSYLPRPPYYHHATPNNPSSTDHMRVINPPRRINSGIWFMLQASQTQAKEPYLPQISKSYLRIKDGRMTVRLLMKYLVNKLSLDSESEVEITCRGQEIEGSWTLQHVRDHIWSPPQREIPPLPLTVNDHLMLLHYGRRSPP